MARKEETKPAKGSKTPMKENNAGKQPAKSVAASGKAPAMPARQARPAKPEKKGGKSSR